MILMYYFEYQWQADLFFITFQPDICSPVRMDRKFKNNLDRFYYISGNMVLQNGQ